MSRASTALIVIMAGIIAVLAWLLWVKPASAPTTSTQHTATSSTSAKPAKSAPPPASKGADAAPLDTKVVVTSPRQGAMVSRSFTIKGSAPGGWFFEAVFPVMVRDRDGNVIGRTQGKAQGDWTQPGPIPFTAQVFLDAGYTGPATVILMRDNPSGLPQNDDSVEIPVVVQ